MTETPPPARSATASGLLAAVRNWPRLAWLAILAALAIGFGIGSLLSLADDDTDDPRLTGRVEALDAATATLATRLVTLEGPLKNAPAAVPVAVPAVDTSTLDRRILDLEQSSQRALGTLDQQMQALAKDLESTRLAPDAEPAQRRDRQTPPLMRLASQLAGRAVLFSEGDQYADPNAAEALMRKVAAWLMEAGPAIGLRIIGYADIDNSGEPSNRITSQKRADAVRDAMVQLGIAPDRLIAVGRSTEDRLVNDDSVGNANRRVSFAPFYLANKP